MKASSDLGRAKERALLFQAGAREVLVMTCEQLLKPSV